MINKILCLIGCCLLALGLSGCNLITADTAELLTPPALSGDMKPIADAINKTIPQGYTLKYPSRGNYRSAVVREDINSDGVLEAFAFYSVTDGETITMHMNYIRDNDGEWSSVAVHPIIAAGVDKIEFADLNGDGVSEILVGWQIYGTSEMQLGVYSLEENSITQRMLEKYTHFLACDLDEDARNEVMIINVSSAQENSAVLYALNEDGVTARSFCGIDRTATTVNEPVLATLSNGQPAVYVDIIKGVGAVTEVLFLQNDKLLNPLFDSETGETLATLRPISFGVRDVNEDGIIDIPVQMEVPSVTRSDINEKLYLTNWCSFNGEVLTNQMTTMINVNDGYCLTLSSRMVGNIAVLKDTAAHVRELYSYNPQDMTVGTGLLYIKAIKMADWESGKYRDERLREIMNDGKTVFACEISGAAAEYGIDMKYVQKNFKLWKDNIN